MTVISKSDVPSKRLALVGVALKTAFLGALVVIIGLIAAEGYRDRAAKEELRRRARVGMTLGELEVEFGKPRKVLHRGKDGDHCAMAGYERPDLRFENRCLVYFGERPGTIMYVFVGSDDVVSYVFVGGSS